jgi:3-methyl-2-oxobutanoate hydroxymethyltransferase
MKKPTIKDLFELKGKRQLTQLLVLSPDEAKAAEEAGVEMTIAPGGDTFGPVREATPNTFLTGGVGYTTVSSAEEAIRAGFSVMRQGADAVYCYTSLEFTKAMADQGIPVVGHVGLVPHVCSWTGGFKAVGKTADTALQVYRDTLAYQEAGALGVEFEVVPHKITEEIRKRVDILIISMGAGEGDVQYLFGMDVQGSHTGHYPRHAKKYADIHAEMQKIQKIRIDAYRAFKADVDSGAFPPPECAVEIQDEEYEKFMEQVDEV